MCSYIHLHVANVVQGTLVITAKSNTTSANHLRVRMEVHALTVWEVTHALAVEVTPATPANSKYVNFSANEIITCDNMDYHFHILTRISSYINCAGDMTTKIQINIINERDCTIVTERLLTFIIFYRSLQI